jgi:hypothetical protein
VKCPRPTFRTDIDSVLKTVPLRRLSTVRRVQKHLDELGQFSASHRSLSRHRQRRREAIVSTQPTLHRKRDIPNFEVLVKDEGGKLLTELILAHVF